MKTAVIYARVSSSNDRQDTSRQIEDLKKYAISQDIEIVNIFQEHISGAKKIEERPFDILDLNMGCPVPKIVNNGEGSALMKNPKLAGEIIEKTVKAIKKPVTVKIRKGFDDDHINAVEMAKIAEASGAAAVAVHGRTREQFYSGKADWDIIRQVKEAVKIPITSLIPSLPFRSSSR